MLVLKNSWNGLSGKSLVNGRKKSFHLPMMFSSFQDLNQKMSLTYLNACVIAHTRKSPKRNGQDAIQLPDDLPIEKQVIDLPEQQKICPEKELSWLKSEKRSRRKLPISQAVTTSKRLSVTSMPSPKERVFLLHLCQQLC